MFVMTRTHETFYREELSGASGVVAQPANRGTGVAIIVALLRVLQRNADAVIAFFPSDHYIADDSAFASAVRSATGVARKRPGSLVLLGARPQWPEVEYGWIEPGAPIPNRSRIPLFKVCRFWEKPPLARARELMRTGGLWNTFVIVGHAGAFLESLNSTAPAVVSRIADALAHDDLEGAYHNLDAIDFSKDVLSREPHRLLVMQDSASGWADLGTPGRVIDTLVRHRIEPEWLSEMRRANVQTLHDPALAQMSSAAGGRINSKYGVTND
jgi:mannose-1-phosphate guanylyltransferase